MVRKMARKIIPAHLGTHDELLRRAIHDSLSLPTLVRAKLLRQPERRASGLFGCERRLNAGEVVLLPCFPAVLVLLFCPTQIIGHRNKPSGIDN